MIISTLEEFYEIIDEQGLPTEEETKREINKSYCGQLRTVRDPKSYKSYVYPGYCDEWDCHGCNNRRIEETRNRIKGFVTGDTKTWILHSPNDEEFKAFRKKNKLDSDTYWSHPAMDGSRITLIYSNNFEDENAVELTLEKAYSDTEEYNTFLSELTLRPVGGFFPRRCRSGKLGATPQIEKDPNSVTEKYERIETAPYLVKETRELHSMILTDTTLEAERTLPVISPNTLQDAEYGWNRIYHSYLEDNNIKFTVNTSISFVTFSPKELESIRRKKLELHPELLEMNLGMPIEPEIKPEKEYPPGCEWLQYLE